MAAFSERVGEHIKCSVAGETYTSYAPKPLPPIPAIEMQKIHPLLDRANIALGHLDGLSILLPDPSLFLSIYVYQERSSFILAN